MNESETNLDMAPDNTVAALQEEIQSLRTLMVGALLVLIVFSASLDFFLSRQARIASTQAADAQKYIDEFNTLSIPPARDFWNKLTEFSKTHPDVSPILAKYSPYFQVPATNVPAAALKK
jgi:hypothetical protein